MGTDPPKGGDENRATVVDHRLLPFLGVIRMIKYDVLTGLLVGLVVGLSFTAALAPHIATIVILAVVFGARMISLK